MVSSSLNWSPSSPRLVSKAHPPCWKPSAPPGSSATPSSDTNSVTTIFPTLANLGTTRGSRQGQTGPVSPDQMRRVVAAADPTGLPMFAALRAADSDDATTRLEGVTYSGPAAMTGRGLVAGRGRGREVECGNTSPGTSSSTTPAAGGG